MNRIITFLVFFVISLNCFSQYPKVIDSILIKLIGNSRLLVVDNGIGERLEYYFNENGKIVEENYFGIFDDIDKSDSIFLFIDSTKILKDDFITTSYTVDLNTLDIIQESILHLNCNIDSKIILPDTVKWTFGCHNRMTDYSIVYNDYKIVSYQSILTLSSGRKLIDSWRIRYEKGKIYLFDDLFIKAYVIFLDNDLPIKIEHYNLSSYRNEIDLQQAFIDNSKKDQAIERYKVYYGNIKNKPHNTITSKRTLRRYKKFAGIE